jgi:hypothetical protein
MPHELEIRPIQEMGDVCLLAREEIIETDHVVFLLDQSLAEVRPEKAGAAGDENSLKRRHVLVLVGGSCLKEG